MRRIARGANGISMIVGLTLFSSVQCRWLPFEMGNSVIVAAGSSPVDWVAVNRVGYPRSGQTECSEGGSQHLGWHPIPTLDSVSARDHIAEHKLGRL